MKTAFYFYVLVSILLIGCDTIEPTQHFVSVAIDQTEITDKHLSSNFCLEKLKNANLYDGIEISIIPIYDTQYHSKYRFSLDKGITGWLGNDDQRRTQRKVLFKEFKIRLDSVQTESKNLEGSEIFKVICSELNYLSSKKGHRTLLIDSNLSEHNNDFFSVYNPRQEALLYQNLNAVVSLFESSVNLANDLTNIDIHFLYQPSLVQNKRYSKMIELYTTILEKRGAKIHIGYQYIKKI